MNLTVSVITAVYNRADTVAQALASVRAQTWGAVEHIVIDGASTDGSLAILQAHRAQLAVLVSEPDKGIYDFNWGQIPIVCGHPCLRVVTQARLNA